MGKIDLKLFIKERNEAVLSFDIEKYKNFYEKWTKRGFYCIELPSDKVLEITLRKMVLLMKNPPKDKLEEARKWLRDNNYSEEVKKGYKRDF